MFCLCALSATRGCLSKPLKKIHINSNSNEIETNRSILFSGKHVKKMTELKNLTWKMPSRAFITMKPR